MATEPAHDMDVKTRANLAYIWTVAIIAFIGFIVVKWGERMEILTLIIGFVTGTAATILAVYFGAPIGAKKPDTTVNKADSVNINSHNGDTTTDTPTV